MDQKDSDKALQDLEGKPQLEGQDSKSEQLQVGEGDRFSKGKVAKFFFKNRYGFVRTALGKDIYFNLDEVRWAGSGEEKPIREGMTVGYDVAWTRKGLHVSKLKVYD